MLVFAPALAVLVAPGLDQLWISERLKTIGRRCHQDRRSVTGHRPAIRNPAWSLRWARMSVLTNGAGAADAGARTGGLALIEDGEKGAFLARLAELQADATVVGDLSGFNYSRGRKQHVTVYRVGQLHALN